jgi:hypothetical protein
MPLRDFFLAFIRRLNLTRCPYMITGAAASIIYGEPRLTNDLDLVLDLKKGDAPEFAQAFPLEEFYCPPEEVIILEIGVPFAAISISSTTKPVFGRMFTSQAETRCIIGV